MHYIPFSLLSRISEFEKNIANSSLIRDKTYIKINPLFFYLTLLNVYVRAPQLISSVILRKTICSSVSSST